jgi:hypothetical protein
MQTEAGEEARLVSLSGHDPINAPHVDSTREANSAHWVSGRAGAFNKEVVRRWPGTYAGKTVPIAQTNNSYIFPGLALEIVHRKARRVTDTMVKAAAQELIRQLPTRKDKQASLLPPIADARQLSHRTGRGGTSDTGGPCAGRGQKRPESRTGRKYLGAG